VQKHISKCFEAISQLIFNKAQCVTGMLSSEKEEVQYVKAIDVNEGEKKGNVEVWLKEIEQVMIRTLKKITQDCERDEDCDRNLWIRKYQAMCILVVNMLRWTHGAEAILLKEEKTGGEMKGYWEFLETQLKRTVELVRQELTPLERLTLGALIVIDVHARDVIEILVSKNVQHHSEFEWIAQLRYYSVADKANYGIKCRMINAELQYGFEYLGNSSRLVITPLTDRCYRTLMGAFHLYYGGAPEGPAGTGKTETVKDLAKAMAVPCAVFNCSDGLNYLAMRKFFKGLASSGAWCCFD
jgi:dynein heavy chain